MVPTSHHDNQQPGDLIGLDKALAILTADFLSDRHSKRLLLDLLGSGRLSGFGTQEFAASNASGGTPGVERIEADFWLRMDERWDGPAQGFSTGRFMSSGTSDPHDSNHRSSPTVDDEESTIIDHYGDGEELEGGSNYLAFYRDVQVSRGQLDMILTQLDLDFDAVDVEHKEGDDEEPEVKQVGRKISKQWPVWIGQACKLAYEHKFHQNTSPNQVVELVSNALHHQTLARSTVRRAAEEIMEAIKQSPIRHRFGT